MNKKTRKSPKNKLKTAEKQLDIIEVNIDRRNELVEEKKKAKEEKKEKEKERQRKIKEKTEAIREDLKNQLVAQNKSGKQFDDMIEDYIYLVKLKEELQYDIKKNGIRYETMTGNGFKTEKPNESCERLLKVNAQMLKILQDLNLKAPEEGSGEEGDLL